MGKTKQIFTNTRVIVLIIFLLLALFAIRPNPWAEGAAIRSVAKDSPAAEAGIQSPKAGAPTSKEVVTLVNNKEIRNSQDYYEYISTLKPNITINIKTNKGFYKVLVGEEYIIKELNETIEEERYNPETNTTTVVEIPKIEKIPTGQPYIGLRVFDAPKNNVRKGLDLEGGTRVLLQPEEKVSQETLSLVIDNLKQRLNLYGLSDIVVRQASDLGDNQYVRVEIAGATQEEVKSLVAQQGKFEAKIGEEVVFIGGRDITSICTTAECSGLDPRQPCGQTGEGYACTFHFSITLTSEAAQRQADATKNLTIEKTETGGAYLNKSLDLYLDNELVDSLKISSDLQGRPVTDISISGPGTGLTRQEAAQNALLNMKKLQTVLKTGSLPVKMNLEQTETVSALLGKDFLRNAVIVGLLAIAAVAIVIFIRYRKLAITVPLALTAVFEVVLLLGLASSIGWNIDLAAIAGIIIAVGTGVDHQIVITDEILTGEREKIYNWKQMIKKAFFIIMAAYFTTVVAMIPLWFAGAGLLKGFALTTIFGISFGVFLTRPAYAAIVEILLRK